MSTSNFNLLKLDREDLYNITSFNDNMDTIDTEMAKPPLTVNEVEPDENRNIQINTVPLADNLTSDEAQINTGTYIIRTSGGEASISNGAAMLTSIKGNMIKTGYVPESITPTADPVDPTSQTAIGNVTVDRDTFVSQVSSSQTLTFTYTTGWSSDPATYGITYSGTPASGDKIIVVYVKENRGTITAATPTSFISTGWNLYNHAAGYARVVDYSEEYGFMIDGDYTALTFAETLSGTQTSITPVDGYFTVPSDGYVFVSGGNDTNTMIWMTWSDWIEEPNDGVFEAYTSSSVDLSGVMVNFPYGLMKIGNVHDEINLNTGKAYSRIVRTAYDADLLAELISQGIPYDTDTGYIYYVSSDPTVYNISLDGSYTANDHGVEMFLGTTVPVTASSLYGNDLKGKLRRDVLTISEQALTSGQKEQVWENLGIDALDDRLTGLANAQVMTVYISGSSSDPTYGLEAKTSAFTITGKALIIAGFAAPSGQSPAYTVHHRIDILTSTDSIYSSGADVQDNYGSSYRVNFRTAIITEPGTYKVVSRIIPQSGSTVSISDYSWGRLHVAVIPLE